MSNNDEIVNVVSRWETLGLLEGLNFNEKMDLAQIYDDATKLLLSNSFTKTVPKKVSDTMDEVFIPICRRLYRRVGTNFDLENMMSDLLTFVNDNLGDIFSNNTIENHLVNFCIEFADNYSDELIESVVLSDSDYNDKVEIILNKLRNVLLSDKPISNVDFNGNEIILNFSNNERSKHQIRFINQNMAKNLLNITLNKLK